MGGALGATPSARSAAYVGPVCTKPSLLRIPTAARQTHGRIDFFGLQLRRPGRGPGRGLFYLSISLLLLLLLPLPAGMYLPAGRQAGRGQLEN